MQYCNRFLKKFKSMKKTNILILSIALLSQSCATISTTFKHTFSTLRRPSDIVVSAPQVVTKPILANLDIDMEKKKTSFNTTIPISESREFARKEAEQKAEFRFLEEHQCDFVLDPYLETEISYVEGDEYYRVSVKVTGLPVSYKKFTELDSLPRIFVDMSKLPGRNIPLIASLSSKRTSSSDHTEFGVMGGMNFSWFSGDETLNSYLGAANTFSMNSKIGGSLGFYGLFRSSSAIGLRTECQLFFRNYDLKRSYSLNNGGNPLTRLDQFEYRSTGVDLPVLLDISLSDQLSIHAGPSLSIIVDESIKKLPNDSFTQDILSESNSLKLNPAINIGMNYNLDRYYIGARYYSQLPVDSRKDRVLSGLGLHMGIRF